MNKVISKQNPQLKKKSLSDGRESLYLEYYLGRVSTPILDEFGEPVCYTTGKMKGKPMFQVRHKRRKDFLGLYLISKPNSTTERLQNKHTLRIAEAKRQEEEQKLLEQGKGYKIIEHRNINFLDSFQTYIDNYTKKDIRMMEIALHRFKDFVHDTPEYNIYEDYIKPEQITKDMMLDFTDYLQSRSVGEGAKSIYQRFKKFINYEIEHGEMLTNPCKGVFIKVDDKVLRKDILSMDEMKKLSETHYPYENPEIRKAFLFCCLSGLRFCDVKDLTFANVDYSNRLLKFEQNKTRGHSASSGVVIPLNDNLLGLIGKPQRGLSRDSKVFNLPTYETCCKALKRWVKRAGIDKHISWHCARHSFAVNILNNGANIKTVSSLLGHSSLQHTEKYTRAIDKLKEDAINSLPTL